MVSATVTLEDPSQDLMPMGSVVRTDVCWEHLGVLSSQLYLQLKLVFMRKKSVIYFL